MNRWRRQRYWCSHAVKDADENRVCNKQLCDLPVLIDCCENCESYQGKDRGLGDTINRATKALGIKTCSKCQQRREAMNRATRKLYRSEDNGSDH